MYNERGRNILLIKVNFEIKIPYCSKYRTGIFLISSRLEIDNYFQLFREKSLRISHLHAFFHQHGVACRRSFNIT